ncbi:MAG: AAA family ATPase [Planctomycetes bacterium]|nr:AAA family ATPase [Planctomycetota bacterium]
MIAGPNGAGKSTTAPALLRDLLGIREFVNADAIAQGMSGFDPDAAAIAAGRAMLRRLTELSRAGHDFAFETTLASRSFAPWIARLKADGYAFALVFLWLPNPEIAIARVAHRVAAGGHDVPVATIRRRFDRGLANFFRLYLPLADSWFLYDNSAPAASRPIARGSGSTDADILDEKTWRALQDRYSR